MYKLKQTQTNQIEWKEVEIGELLDYEQPGNYIVQSEILKEKTKSSVPVLTANKSFILGYTEEKKGIYENHPVIIFDDFTTDTKFVDFKFKVKSSAMKLLRPKSKDVNLKFVFLMMKGIQLNFSTHKRYYLSVYQKRKILMPFKENKLDIEEQEKFVRILNNSLELSEKGEKVENLFNEYLNSIFYEMFYNGEFEEVPLGDVCEINPKKSELENVDKESEVSFLEMASVGERGEIFHEDIRKLKEVMKGFTYFKKDDVLFAKITPCMENGKGAIAKISRKIGFGSTEFHILRPNKKIISEFIYFLLSLDSFRKIAGKNMTGSAGQKRVPKLFLQTLKIPLSSLPLQQKFAKIVEQIETMKESVNKTKQKSEELFNSLVSKGFRGEL